LQVARERLPGFASKMRDEDMFDLQDHVTASVVGATAPKLEQAEIERAKRKPTECLDAFDYHLRGMTNLYRWTNEGVSEALRLFHRAIALDPGFASAHAVVFRSPPVNSRFRGAAAPRSQETSTS
jgi:adenylate cyclase